MTDQHVRIKHSWSLADKYFENKSILVTHMMEKHFLLLVNAWKKYILLEWAKTH